MTTGVITGGCQCGAIRYRADRLVQAVLCHCRMCQRAVGHAFGATAWADGVEFTGERTMFSSSNAAQRGFCQTCGTPLSFQINNSPKVWVTLGSLDDPSAIEPSLHYGVESRLDWAEFNDGLPCEAINPGGFYESTPNGITSYQHPTQSTGTEEQ